MTSKTRNLGKLVSGDIDLLNLESEDISYDNTNSGLNAVNTQEAIDEINQNIIVFAIALGD